MGSCLRFLRMVLLRVFLRFLLSCVVRLVSVRLVCCILILLVLSYSLGLLCGMFIWVCSMFGCD